MVEETNIEDVTEMDLVYEAHDRLDALIELLIEKEVFTEAEFEEKLERVYSENYEESE